MLEWGYYEDKEPRLVDPEDIGNPEKTMTSDSMRHLDLEEIAEQLKIHPDVIDVAPYLSTQIVINNNDVSKGINLKGTSKESEISIIPDIL